MRAGRPRSRVALPSITLATEGGNAASRASQMRLNPPVLNWFHKLQPAEPQGLFQIC